MEKLPETGADIVEFPRAFARASCPVPLSDLPLCSHITQVAIYDAADHDRALNAVQNSRDHEGKLTPGFRKASFAHLDIPVTPAMVMQAVKEIRKFLAKNGKAMFTPANLSEEQIIAAFPEGSVERTVLEGAKKAGLYLAHDDFGVWGVPPDGWNPPHLDLG